MKQKVALARTLIHDPEVLLLDEPTANLDPEAVKAIRDIILDLKKENSTILLNTHNLDEAQCICNRIGVLKTKLIATDTPQNLERALSGRQTVILLEEVTDKILSAVKAANPKNVEKDGNRLIIEINNPEKETPTMTNAIVSVGKKIKFVPWD
ncbi:MAG: AAA family ATPase [Thermoplasmata archaeon]